MTNRKKFSSAKNAEHIVANPLIKKNDNDVSPVEICQLKEDCRKKWHYIDNKINKILGHKRFFIVELNEKIKNKYESGELNPDTKTTITSDELTLVNSYDLLIERNKRITEEYKKIAEKNPENRWAKLASYVSSQAGCAMKETRSVLAQTAGRIMRIDPNKALDALSMANEKIFSSVGAPFIFISQYGYEQFAKCARERDQPIDADIISAAKDMSNGKLKQAADKLAEIEQLEIVQPVYEKYEATFENIDFADRAEGVFWGSRDRQSIALEYKCDVGTKVPLGELKLGNSEDRVEYYQMLMKELNKKEKYDYGK